MTPTTATTTRTGGTAKSMNGVQPAPRRRRRWTAEQKAEVLQRFASSGRSLTQFCEQAGLSTGMISAWRRRHRTDATRGFAQVRLTAAVPSPSAAPVVVRWGERVRLDVPAGTDPVWLGRLLQQLADASPGC
jgi:transposase